MTFSGFSGVPFVSLLLTTHEEVLKLNTSSLSKYSHSDFIPFGLIKSGPHLFAEVNSTLANVFLSRGQFPYVFQQASIIPILKKRGIDSSSFSNYRPISNLNTISKLLEHLFLSRIQAHVLTSRNYNKNQST